MVRLRFFNVSHTPAVQMGSATRHQPPGIGDYCDVPGRPESWMVVRRRQRDTDDTARGDLWDIALEQVPAPVW